MELWIRSQDKKILEKCEDLFSAYLSSKRSYAICSHKNMVTLGLYKSEERALEVLDEIQHKLITLCDSMNRHLYVYEMPKE